jgi:Protein of unknown function (DUF3572)
MRASPENGNASNTPSGDPHLVALMALGWILQDGRRAQRLLDLTGLDARGLREGAGDSALLAAVIVFLESHEPDLIACADSLGVSPAHLVQVKEELSR